MTTSTTENPEVRELRDRGLKLSRDERELLAFDLLDSLEPEPLADTLRRRSDEIASGKEVLLTREEAEAEVREKMRQIGFEL